MLPSALEQSPSIHVPEIDEQHRMLMALMRDLYDDVRLARGNQAIGEVFDELVEYTRYHFAGEERWMRDIQFPGYLLHKAVHDEVCDQLAELRAHFEKTGRSAVDTAVLEFLCEWLISHITVEDQAIVAYLSEPDGDWADAPVSVH